MKTRVLPLLTAAMFVLSCKAPQKTTQSAADTPASNVDHAAILAQIPKSFTPNGDGQNDELCFATAFAQLPGAVVKIYNRWGVMVWETTEANNCWDGKEDKSKSALPHGVYPYTIHPKTGKDIIGQVILIR
jgi:gliding motility-associated-like protein